MKKIDVTKSVLAGLFSAVTIGVLTLLTYKTELGVFLIKKILLSQKSGLYLIKYLINKTFLEKNACYYLLKLLRKR